METLDTVHIRRATPRDAVYLVAFVDMASEGFASYFWNQMAGVGQSPFEVGRARALREEGSFTWRNADIAEVDGEVAGGLVGYRIPDSIHPAEIENAPELFRPLAALEAEAPGHWYVNVLAVFPEFRGKGVGAALLRYADELGRATGSRGMAMIVASENAGALRLYERAGYRLAQRRPLVAFPGFKRGGDWVLLTKPHSASASGG